MKYRNNTYAEEHETSAAQELDKAIEAAQQKLSAAVEAKDVNAVSAAQSELTSAVMAKQGEEIRQRIMAEMREMDVERADEQALAQRGLRQLTSDEKDFYQHALPDLIRTKDPKQAITGGSVILPGTTIERVFEDLRTDHALLRRINFVYTGAAVKFILNTNPYQKATRGTLCAEIVTELSTGFAAVKTDLVKISAFIPVCKELLEFGPMWLDRYVREVLYEAFANGLEDGVINGSGRALGANGSGGENDRDFIGMRYQFGPDVTVTGGVYPLKELISVSDLSVTTLGNLIGLVAIGPNGQNRPIRDLIMVVNPADRYTKVDPATLFRRDDGSYIRSTPYPFDVIESPAVPVGEAVFGLGYRYAAFAGSPTEGNIDYSDHYQFLEDNRVYLVKGFGNGYPMDNNAFLRLDISGLQPLQAKVVVVDERTPSTDATLASLTLGAATLSPAFDPDVDTYTAATTSASNTIKAVPADAGATMVIKLGDVEVANGSALTWEAGSNTVTVTVTAEDGTTTETYTVTVTKS